MLGVEPEARLIEHPHPNRRARRQSQRGQLRLEASSLESLSGDGVFFDVAAATHFEPRPELSQMPIDLLVGDLQTESLLEPALRVAGGAPLALGQFGAEALPLLGAEAGRFASAGTVGVAEEFGEASLAEPADPFAEGAGAAAHDLGDPAVSLLAFQGQANGLESLGLPRSALYSLLFKNLRGLVVDIDRSAGSWHGAGMRLSVPLSITKWY